MREFCSCSRLPLLPDFACSSHATWRTPYSRGLYMTYGKLLTPRAVCKLTQPHCILCTSHKSNSLHRVGHPRGGLHPDRHGHILVRHHLRKVDLQGSAKRSLLGCVKFLYMILIISVAYSNSNLYSHFQHLGGRASSGSCPHQLRRSHR